VIARALHAITPLIENQMVVRKALHEPVSPLEIEPVSAPPTGKFEK
jgi:hypothetical protein